MMISVNEQDGAQDQGVHQPQTQHTQRGPQPDLQDAALALRELFGNGLVYDELHDGWFRWTGAYWQDAQHSKTELDRMATEACRNVGVSISNSGKIDGTLRLAKALMVREFDENPNLVSFRNGTLEIERHVDENGIASWGVGRLREHRAGDDQKRCMPYGIDLVGEHPAISKFLSTAIPDPLARDCLIAHIGLALVRDVSMHYAVVLYGPPRSGKSSVLALARMVCGAKNQGEATDWTPSNVFDNDLEAKRTRFIRRNEPVACIDEIPSAALRGEEIFKMMSAHGGVPMRGIGRDDATDTTWLAKIIMATNSTPSFKDASGAIANRLVPIKVPNHRSEAERDLDLLEKLKSELGAFAATCIHAALATRNRGYYNRSRAQINTLMAWANLGNPLRAFVEEHCVVDPGARVLVAEFFWKYTSVLEGSDQRSLQQANMVAELLDMSLGVLRKKARAVKTFRDTQKGSIAHHLAGIRLKEAHEYTEVGTDDLDADEQDYRPATESDIALGERADSLIALGKYREAYVEVLRMQNREDREFALKTMCDQGFLNFEKGGTHQQAGLFDIARAA